MPTEKTPNDFIHNRLKYYRKESGLTQLQVANALGIDRSTYTYYETGRSHPKYHHLNLLSKLLNVPISDFLDDEAPVCSVADKTDSHETQSHENDDSQSQMTLRSLTRDEQNLILKFRLYSAKQKEELLVSLGVKENRQDN